MTTTLKLSSAMEARLAAEARVRRVSKSQVIRESLEKHFKTNGRRKHLTFGVAVGHLAGCFNGPRDLSTNRKHMKGYGG